MGYFNIDFNKFKPSSKLNQPSTTPSVQQKLETNLQRLSPTQVPQPTPTPSPAPITPQPQVQEQPKTGMGRVFELLNKPSEWVQRILTKGTSYEKSLESEKTRKVLAAVTSIPQAGLTYKQNLKSMETEGGRKIYGAAGRFFLDPLNFIPFEKGINVIGKGVSLVKEATGVTKLADKVIDFAKATPEVYKVVEKFNPYFRNPEFGKILGVSEEVTGKRLNELYKLIKKTAENLSPEEQAKIGQILEGGIDSSKRYEKLAAPLRQLTEDIGKEAVDLGILSRESFNKYKGVYMKHIFEKYIGNATEKGYVRRVAPGIGEQFTKMRKGAEGYIKEFAAPTFVGVGSGIKDIEAAKFYKKIATDFGADAEAVREGRKVIDRLAPEGFAYAPDAIKNTKVAKFFKNKALPNSIIDYINRTTEIKKVTGWDKMLGAWKAGKTIYNPAYHIRNLLSNQILTDMSTGEGLLKTATDYVDAVRTYVGKGNQKFVDAAEGIGLIKQKRFGAVTDEFLQTAEIVDKSKGRKILDFPRKLQNVTEETSKLNVFKSWVEKFAHQAGKTVDDALKDPEIVKKAAAKAQEAIFSPYRLGETERDLAKNIIPFYSFTRQVVPFTAKTLLKHPGRLAKYSKIKREIEYLSENKPKPAYAENFIRLPFKNKRGEQAYIDPTYIYPFGNAFSPLGSDTGANLPFGLGFNPLFTEIAQQMANKDYYYNQPITKYESQGIAGENRKARAAHIFRTVSPQVINNIVSKVVPAITGKPDYAGRERNVIQALADTFAGVKTQFIGSQKGILDQYYQGKQNIRSKQNDIKRILNDNSLTDTEKRRMLNKVLQ